MEYRWINMDFSDEYLIYMNRIFMLNAMMGLNIRDSQEFRRSNSSNLSPIRKPSISLEDRRGEVEVYPSERFQLKKYNCSDYKMAEQNALELIEEEEKSKLKAEKKRAKKQRQKQKKFETAKSKSDENGHTSSDNAVNKMSNEMEKLMLKTNNKEAEGLDLRAAFMSNAIKKLKSTVIIQDESQNKKEENDINSIIKTASEYESSENFKEAVKLYSDAIILAPNRFDLILKRSHIYYLLGKFEKSIRDAQKVLQSSADKAEGYYRIAEAQFGLNNLSDAEATYIKLLSLNSYPNEARKRLFSIRVKQLEEMGYQPNEAYTALLKSKNKTIDEAIEFLTNLEEAKENTEDIYYSDEEEEESEEESGEEEDNEGASNAGPPLSKTVVRSTTPISISNKSPLLTDPSNPFACCSLFVGNLKKGITNKEIYDVFVRFGDIKSIKLTTEPNCYTFVNYYKSDSAGQAMEALQNSRWLLSTISPLIIKYPINVVNRSIPYLKNPQLILDRLNDLPSHSNNFTRKATLFEPIINIPATSTQRNVSNSSGNQQEIRSRDSTHF